MKLNNIFDKNFIFEGNTICLGDSKSVLKVKVLHNPTHLQKFREQFLL